MDEVFGSENFQAMVTFQDMTTIGTEKGWLRVYDFHLWYAKT